MGRLTSHDATDADKTQAPRPAQLVYMDSTDLHWCPDIGNGYVRKGDQIQVQSPQDENPWAALFGSLVYPTGEGVYTIHERKRHQEVAAHIRALIELDDSCFWFIILDNA
jgi:hypothetical protein